MYLFRRWIISFIFICFPTAFPSVCVGLRIINQLYFLLFFGKKCGEDFYLMKKDIQVVSFIFVSLDIKNKKHINNNYNV